MTPVRRADARSTTAPGLLLCVAAGLVSVLLHGVLAQVSPLLLAIALGVVVANVRTLPEAMAPGVAVAGRRLLRVGIVLLGLSVPLQAVLALGPGVLLLVLAVVAGGIALTLACGKALGVPPAQRLLIACGFSICGAAAVAAVTGVVDADDEDTAAAIALVVVFGTVMIGLVPLLSAALGLGFDARGVLAGASIHEVAQVVAAGGVIGSGALAVAVLVKLARVLLLAPVMAGIGLWQRRQSRGPSTGGRQPPLLPLFVVGFVIAVAARSVGVLPQGVLDAVAQAQTLLLATAMFALGLGVRVSGLRRLGPRPVVLGALSTAVVTLIASIGVLAVG